jgi:hypothetical protein
MRSDTTSTTPPGLGRGKQGFLPRFGPLGLEARARSPITEVV